MVEGAEVTDASWLTQDAGREKRVTVEYAYAGGGSAHVGHLAALDASNAREPLVFTLQCKQQARYAGFVGDAVTVSLPEIGLSSTKMVVVSRIVNTDGTVDYELLVETDAKYAFAAGKTSAAPSFTLQPGFDIFSVPQPDLADWTAVAAQITSGATSLPIVRVTGSAANYNFASGVVFKLRLNSIGSPWLVSEDAPPAATQHEFRGLTNNTGYIVGIAYRGVTGVEGPVRELAAVTTGTLVAGEAGAAATVPWTGVTGSGRPADGATVNRITSSTTAPSSPVNGDIWVDTNTPVTIKTRVAGAWVVGGNVPTALSQVNPTEGSKLAGVAVGSTKNIVSTGLFSARPVGSDGDFYYATDTLQLFQKVSGSWFESGTVGARVGTNIFPNSGSTPLPGTQLLNDFVPQTGNRVRFSNFEVISPAWLLSSNNAAPITSFALTQVSGLPLLTVLYTAPGNGSIIRIYTGAGIEATAGEWLMPSVGVKCDGSFVAQTRAYLAFYNSSGGVTGTASATPRNGGQALNTKMVWPTAVEVPSGTVRCALFIEIEASSSGAISLGITHPIVVSGFQGQTSSPFFVPGLNAYDAADVTGANTAAAIAGQGNQATRNTTAGTLASRPTGADGDSYHATDTKEMYYKIGGSWVKVADVANTFNVSLSTSNITVTGAPGTLTTGSVTATVTGGSGSYNYAWAVITKDVQSLNPFMTSQSATSSCRATLGSGQAVSGTIQLTVTDNATGAIQIRTLTYSINTNS